MTAHHHHHHHHRRQPPRRAGAGLLAVSVGAALVLGACGDDDDNADVSDAAPATVAAGTTTAATAAAAPAQAATSGACAPYFEITAQFNGDPDPELLTAALDDLDANAPPEVADSVGLTTSAARQVLDSGGEDFSPFETPEFMAARNDINGWAFENCEFDATYEVTATEYAFEGMPAEVEAGLIAVKLTNEGQEAHELGVVRRLEGTTEAWDELLQMPWEELDVKVEFLGSGFAPTTGSAGYAFIDTSAGGEYAALCFVPTGTVMTAEGETTDGSGPPHAMQGMIHEFSVV